jgi:hypothetical protein
LLIHEAQTSFKGVGNVDEVLRESEDATLSISWRCNAANSPLDGFEAKDAVLRDSSPKDK